MEPLRLTWVSMHLHHSCWFIKLNKIVTRNIFYNNMQRIQIIKAVVVFLLLLSSQLVYAGPGSIANKASVTASSEIAEKGKAAYVVDGIIRTNGKGEWVSKSTVTFWGYIDYPWIQLDWEKPQSINKIILYDRAATTAHNAGGL